MVYCGFYYLLNVIRDRLEFPALERKVIQVYNWWHCTTGRQPTVLIEDKGSASALIQNLRYRSIHVYDVPVGDKVMRMSAQFSLFSLRNSLLASENSLFSTIRELNCKPLI